MRGVAFFESDSPDQASGRITLRMMKKLRHLLIPAVLVLVSGACGYRLRGTGSSLPPHVKTMSIPVFRNQTTRYELDVKLTRAVIDEMVARGKVTIAADGQKADAVLEGEVMSFTAIPIAFTGKTRPDRYNIRVTAKIVLRDRTHQRVLFSNPSFVFLQEYEVPEGSDFETVETEAIDKVAGMFARSLVATILEGF